MIPNEIIINKYMLIGFGVVNGVDLLIFRTSTSSPIPLITYTQRDTE